jgi:sulfur relay (sulfurtransferase) complex TusBCD TusD component (DsrE family)
MIESRDPYESGDVSYFYNLAADLAEAGEQVTLFLVQNGALAARRDAKGDPLGGVLKSRTEVLVDSFALRERGIQDAERHPSVKPAEIGDLVDHIMTQNGVKVLWH